MARKILNAPPVHHKFATMNGEAAVTMMHALLKLPHSPHPWDDLWLDTIVKHPSRDDWWEARNLLPLLKNVDIPVYLGCDWENVPLHLPSTFTAWEALADNPNVRMALSGRFGLTWPWESLHHEALAWYDHWLKGHDTGIMDGPPDPLRAARRRRLAHRRPMAPRGNNSSDEFALRADGDPEHRRRRTAESREYLTLGAGLNRVKPSPIDPPSLLSWTSAPLTETLDVVGDVELRLVASATASDTAWMATLEHVAADGTSSAVTAGWMRASLREVDEAASRDGAPVLPCRTFAPVPIGEDVEYRIPMVANARRFAAGDRIRLIAHQRRSGSRKHRRS